jgi:hypothetical protein
MKQNTNALVIPVVVAVVAAGGGFLGGMQYQQSKTPARGQFGQFAGATRVGVGGNGTSGRVGQGMRGGAVTGEIIAKDTKSITVKLPDGSSRIVILSSNTAINQASQATADDLKVGTKVAAFGTTNSDGSETAQNIQINPIMRIPDQGNAPTGPSSQSK